MIYRMNHVYNDVFKISLTVFTEFVGSIFIRKDNEWCKSYNRLFFRLRLLNKFTLLLDRNFLQATKNITSTHSISIINFYCSFLKKFVSRHNSTFAPIKLRPFRFNCYTITTSKHLQFSIPIFIDFLAVDINNFELIIAKSYTRSQYYRLTDRCIL